MLHTILLAVSGFAACRQGHATVGSDDKGCATKSLSSIGEPIENRSHPSCQPPPSSPTTRQTFYRALSCICSSVHKVVQLLSLVQVVDSQSFIAHRGSAVNADVVALPLTYYTQAGCHTFHSLIFQTPADFLNSREHEHRRLKRFFRKTNKKGVVFIINRPLSFSRPTLMLRYRSAPCCSPSPRSLIPTLPPYYDNIQHRRPTSNSFSQPPSQLLIILWGFPYTLH